MKNISNRIVLVTLLLICSLLFIVASATGLFSSKNDDADKAEMDDTAEAAAEEAERHRKANEEKAAAAEEAERQRMENQEKAAAAEEAERQRRANQEKAAAAEAAERQRRENQEKAAAAEAAERQRMENEEKAAAAEQVAQQSKEKTITSALQSILNNASEMILQKQPTLIQTPFVSQTGNESFTEDTDISDFSEVPDMPLLVGDDHDPSDILSFIDIFNVEASPPLDKTLIDDSKAGLIPGYAQIPLSPIVASKTNLSADASAMGHQLAYQVSEEWQQLSKIKKRIQNIENKAEANHINLKTVLPPEWTNFYESFENIKKEVNDDEIAQLDNDAFMHKIDNLNNALTIYEDIVSGIPFEELAKEAVHTPNVDDSDEKQSEMLYSDPFTKTAYLLPHFMSANQLLSYEFDLDDTLIRSMFQNHFKLINKIPWNIFQNFGSGEENTVAEWLVQDFKSFVLDKQNKRIWTTDALEMLSSALNDIKNNFETFWPETFKNLLFQQLENISQEEFADDAELKKLLTALDRHILGRLEPFSIWQKHCAQQKWSVGDFSEQIDVENDAETEHFGIPLMRNSLLSAIDICTDSIIYFHRKKTVKRAPQHRVSESHHRNLKYTLFLLENMAEMIKQLQDVEKSISHGYLLFVIEKLLHLLPLTRSLQLDLNSSFSATDETKEEKYDFDEADLLLRELSQDLFTITISRDAQIFFAHNLGLTISGATRLLTFMRNKLITDILRQNDLLFLVNSLCATYQQAKFESKTELFFRFEFNWSRIPSLVEQWINWVTQSKSEMQADVEHTDDDTFFNIASKYTVNNQIAELQKAIETQNHNLTDEQTHNVTTFMKQNNFVSDDMFNRKMTPIRRKYPRLVKNMQKRKQIESKIEYAYRSSQLEINLSQFKVSDKLTITSDLSLQLDPNTGQDVLTILWLTYVPLYPVECRTVFMQLFDQKYLLGKLRSIDSSIQFSGDFFSDRFFKTFKQSWYVHKNDIYNFLVQNILRPLQSFFEIHDVFLAMERTELKSNAHLNKYHSHVIRAVADIVSQIEIFDHYFQTLSILTYEMIQIICSKNTYPMKRNKPWTKNSLQKVFLTYYVRAMLLIPQSDTQKYANLMASYCLEFLSLTPQSVKSKYLSHFR